MLVARHNRRWLMPTSCGIPSRRRGTLPRISGNDRAHGLHTARRTTRTHPRRDDRWQQESDFLARRPGRRASTGRCIPGSSEGSRCRSADRSLHRGRFRRPSRISDRRRCTLDDCSWQVSVKQIVSNLRRSMNAVKTWSHGRRCNRVPLRQGTDALPTDHSPKSPSAYYFPEHTSRGFSGGP